MISMLERGKRHLTLQWMERIAKALECSISDLFNDHSADRELPATLSSVPLFETTEGKVPGTFKLHTDTPLGTLIRPPGVPVGSDVYAFYVAGESMSPEHRNGDLRFADTTAKVCIGDTVLFQTQHHPSDTVLAYIKHVKAMDAESYLLSQINPPLDQIVLAKGVIAAHPILSVNKLFGV